MFDGSCHVAAPSGDGHNLVLLDLEATQVRVIPDEVLALCVATGIVRETAPLN